LEVHNNITITQDMLAIKAVACWCPKQNDKK